MSAVDYDDFLVDTCAECGQYPVDEPGSLGGAGLPVLCAECAKDPGVREDYGYDPYDDEHEN